MSREEVQRRVRQLRIRENNRSCTGIVRPLALEFYHFWASHIARRCPQDELLQPSIVFAPHPDDESLGCGGTIALKRKHGVQVRVVFMCDGSGSHPGLMDADVLQRIRKQEATQACKVLGVPEEEVVFLGTKDGHLDSQRAEITERCLEILTKTSARQVFLPYRKDGHPDHMSANGVVKQAVNRYGKTMILYEYGVHFYRHWPWIRFEAQAPTTTTRELRKCIISAFRFFRDFRCRVPIGNVLDTKLAALEEHRSQMTSFTGDPGWWTLRAISGGDFLRWFCANQELFKREVFDGSENFRKHESGAYAEE